VRFDKIPSAPSLQAWANTVAPSASMYSLTTSNTKTPSVIVDRTGQVRAAIIDFGGFLGVGSRKIAVAWNALHFSLSANKVKYVALELTRDEVRTTPEYNEDKPVVVLGASGSLDLLTSR